jgi:hypothetical protein
MNVLVHMRMVCLKYDEKRFNLDTKTYSKILQCTKINK